MHTEAAGLGVVAVAAREHEVVHPAHRPLGIVQAHRDARAEERLDDRRPLARVHAADVDGDFAGLHAGVPRT